MPNVPLQSEGRKLIVHKSGWWVGVKFEVPLVVEAILLFVQFWSDQGYANVVGKCLTITFLYVIIAYCQHWLQRAEYFTIN